MPEEKGLGKKILGLFVESEKQDEAAAQPEPAEAAEAGKSPAEIVAELAGQGARRPAPGPAAPPMPLPEPGRPAAAVEPASVDFDAFFKQAGIDPGELDRVRKAEELLRGLPEETPQAVKRQIVEASLKAFGFEVAKIVAAAQNQLKGLATYARNSEQQAAKAAADAKAEIGKLEEKIIELKVQIDKKQQQAAGVAAAAEQRKAQVQKVLEFFNAPSQPSANPAPPAKG